MNSILPVVVQHPILLDVASRETLTKTDEPLAPLQFRGFRLHTVWTQQPGEDLVHQVAFPHFLGEATSPMLEYEPERISPELTQGQKMAVNLRPPSNNHWNIVSDLVPNGGICSREVPPSGGRRQWGGTPWQECSPQAVCDRDNTGDLSAHPRSPPPDYA